MVQIVTRAQWGARRPRSRVNAELSRPSTGHWNGPIVRVGGQSKWDHSRCASLVRGIQNFHMDSRGWQDIAYNFLVCPHEYIFEGRGLNIANGANGTNTGNRTSHAICSLAGEGNDFPVEEKRAFKYCVKHIADRTKAPNDAIGHRDHKATACPGNDRYNWIHSGMPVSGGTSPAPAPVNRYPLLKSGNRGEAVRRVQQIIHDHGGGNIVVDGHFGPHTKRRVRDVQNFFGLTADGIVGPKTWDVLNFMAAFVKPNPYSDWVTKSKPLLKEGSRGEAVKYLQDVISRKAGGNIKVDGIFGPSTKQRVKDLQNFFDLGVDGIVGPKTWGIVDFLAVV